MRGFILAAGFGTRMRPITNNIPKALVNVCGKPLLERALNFLFSNGISDIGVNAHYLPQQIELFRERSPIPFSLFVECGEIRGTGGAFDNARSFLAGDDSFLMLNVDIVCRFDLNAAIEKFIQSESVCTLIAFPCDNGMGTIYYTENTGMYQGVPSDTQMAASTSEAAFIGAALYKRQFLDLITVDDFSIVPVWKRAVEKGLTVTVDIQKNGFWRDIGTPQALADVHFDLLDKKLDLDIPSSLYVDTESKRCIPQTVSNERFVSGMYAWVESEVNWHCEISRSIVFKGAQINGIKITNSLVTPWGVLPIS